LFSERARSKGLMVDLKISDQVPASLCSDPMRIRQIVANLLSNSLKFTERGGVTIELLRAGDQICIAVDDTGAGISPDNANVLFQPFVQGDSALSKRHGGTGLGLHLSRKLAEALGGSLKLVEKPAGVHGSRFVFTLPMQEASIKEANQWRNETAALQTENVGDLDGLSILVVDDAADNRKLIERLLSKTGAAVEFAENGIQGVKMALDHEFDLVLMDLQMPDLDGFEATRRIRERQDRTPIVALTAHAVDEIRERCERAGFNGFLTKPLNSKTLLKVAKDLARHHHGAVQQSQSSL
jgi:CheY-like chemotaxis protein